jgi:hypothetical protein
MSRPFSAARSFAVSINAGARSMPVTDAPAEAARSAIAPVPVARSSQRSPGAGASRSITRSWMSSRVSVIRWYGPLPHITLCRSFNSS